MYEIGCTDTFHKYTSVIIFQNRRFDEFNEKRFNIIY